VHKHILNGRQSALHIQFKWQFLGYNSHFKVNEVVFIEELKSDTLCKTKSKNSFFEMSLTEVRNTEMSVCLRACVNCMYA
jgi:hypothetical protein